MAECGGIWTVTGGQGRHDPENRTRGDWRSSNPGGRTARKERTSESERDCGVHERKVHVRQAESMDPHEQGGGECNFSSAVVPLRKNADASGRLLKRAGIGYRFERCGGF